MNAAEVSGARRLVPGDTRLQRNARSRSTRCANERIAARAMSLTSLRVVRTAETCTARAQLRRPRCTPGKASAYSRRCSQIADMGVRSTSRGDELAAGGDGGGERGLSSSCSFDGVQVRCRAAARGLGCFTRSRLDVRSGSPRLRVQAASSSRRALRRIRTR